jgi:hypothetical protein
MIDAMWRPRLWLTLSAALAIVQAGVSFGAVPPSPDSLPPLWTVHIDQVEPRSAAQFEELSGLQSSMRHRVLREHGVVFPPTYEIAADGYMYMTFRGRASLAEMEKPSNTPDDVRQLLRASADTLDPAIHATLRMHHNEIWQLDAEDSYLPDSTARPPGYIHLRFDEVRPGLSAEYDTVVARLHGALVKTRATCGLLVFSAAYGSGAVVLMWSCGSRAQYERDASMPELLKAAYGAREANRLLGLWRRSIVESRDVHASARSDLNDLDPSRGWFAPGAPGR